MPKLVLLPGMDGTGDLFGDFIAALPSSFETVTARYPPDKSLTFRELQELVRAICPDTGPLVVLYASGNSIRSNETANLQGLVLCAGFATSPVLGWKRWIVSLTAPLFLSRALPQSAIRTFLLDRGSPPHLVEQVRQAISSVNAAVLSQRLGDILACDVQTELAGVKVPILYIRGNQDRIVGLSSLKTIQAIKSRTSVLALDAPHLLLQQEPRKSADAVMSFINRHGAPEQRKF